LKLYAEITDRFLSAGMAGLAACPDVRPVSNNGRLVGVETLSFREG